ncbi:hypothetical protein VCSRO210_2443 [Vibrio cholerae]|nr:hypothetical protein [Vibrio cholerae]GHX97451.1 hypothetical protein VCSRO210_2443 [Vibrio cholerae]
MPMFKGGVVGLVVFLNLLVIAVIPYYRYQGSESSWASLVGIS